MNSQPETFDLQLEKFTYGGDAMGRLPDGRAVFVPFGLPGERVRVRLTEEKKNFARGKIIEILEVSKDRITPKCKHFGECGGCHYQNLPYEKQLEIKTEILRDQLTRIGKIENPPVQLMVACPNPWNYRNHAQFSLSKNGILGFIRSLDGPSPSKSILEITECHLPESPINDFWPQLEFEPGTDIERVSLRAGKDEDLMLVLESESPDPPELEIEAGISVVHIYEENTVIIAGNNHIILRVLDRDFKVSAPSFFQVNTIMAEKMVQYLIAQLPVTQASILLDLHCGVGLFSAFFATKCQKVIGVESSTSACADFVINLDEFHNVELYEGTVEEVLPNLVERIARDSFPEGDNPPYVIVDPPRAGIERHSLDAIVRLKPQMIAYVSCDPSTLARDAKRFIESGYKLRQVAPFDLFPQTYHIESISLFER